MSTAIKMVWPTTSKTITQRYGNKSARYVSGRHTGLDIGAAQGEPIYAAHDGRVIRAGWNGAYGNEVAVQHSSGLLTSYHHMSVIKAHIGQSVSAGTIIGLIGSTGQSTGPHLHFEVRINNQHTDPMPYLEGSGVVPIGNNPVIPDVVEGPLDAFEGVFGVLSDPVTWMRVAMVGAGAVLIAMAFVGVAKSQVLASNVVKEVIK